MEFLGRTATNRARIGHHRAEPETQAREDGGVGLVHGVVALRHAFGTDVERVCVLHEEFARTHHAEPRPALVAEFHLDLVEIDRHLAIALELVARDVGDHFLVRGSQAEVALMAILEAQQFGAELVPSAGFHPQLGGNDARHEDFQGAGTIHLLAHDILDLAHGAQAQRHPGVHAR